MNKQLSLFDENPAKPISIKDNLSGTFTDNMKLPVHRWFRYSAGFSSDWVKKIISEKSPLAVLDPFAGSGTTLITSEQCGIKSYGFETHPFISKIAKIKLLWNIKTYDIIVLANKVLTMAKNYHADISNESSLLYKCYTEDSLYKLCSLREIFYQISESENAKKFIWLAITCILRNCSYVGTAQWQYVLPNKRKRNVVDPYDAFNNKIYEIVEDINFFQKNNYKHSAKIIEHDSRVDFPELHDQIDLVITSPPYPNNYDYADATRLEMCFWREINKYGDLQSAVRKYIIRSCTQHVMSDKLNLDSIINNNFLKPIYNELGKICNTLSKERLEHGGKKAYHLMIAAYFLDIAEVFRALRKICKKGSELCFVIGDSAPYGVYVPVDHFMAVLALNSGFKEFYFEKIRDRNIKWKNRKHRVPLQEGRLWIKG